MRSFRFVKNKDRMKTISGIVALIIAIGFNVLIQSLTQSQNTPEDIMRFVEQGNNSILGKIQDIFVVNRFMTIALANYRDFIYSVGNMLLAIVGVGLFLALFLYLGEKLYLKSVVGLTEASSKRTKTAKGNFTKEVVIFLLLL